MYRVHDGTDWQVIEYIRVEVGDFRRDFGTGSILAQNSPALSVTHCPTLACTYVTKSFSEWHYGSAEIEETLSSKQAQDKPLLLFDEFRFCTVVLFHPKDNLARYAHSHVLKIEIVSHKIFQQLVPGCPAT